MSWIDLFATLGHFRAGLQAAARIETRNGHYAGEDVAHQSDDAHPMLLWLGSG